MDYSDELTGLLLDAGADLKDMSLVNEAEVLLRRCVANCRHKGDAGLLEVKCIRELGNIIQISRKSNEYIHLYKTARDLASASKNIEYEETINAHLSLGDAYLLRGELQCAEDEYSAALRIANENKARGSIADYILDRFADLRVKQNRFPEAEVLLKVVINRLEKGHAPLDYLAAGVFLHYGVFLRREKKLLEARSALERSVSIYEAIKTADHPTTAQAKSELGLVLFKLKDIELGQNLCEEAIRVLEESLWPEHASLEAPIKRLADIMHLKGAFVEAAALYRRALDIHVKEKGEKSKGKVSILTRLADSKLRQGDPISARTYLEEAERLFDVDDRDDIDRLSVLACLADAQSQSSDITNAEKNYQHVIKHCPRDDQILIKTYWNFAKMLSEIGRNSEARALYYEALKVIERRQGQKDIELIGAFARLAEWMCDQGWVDDGIAEFEQCVSEMQNCSCAWLIRSAEIHASFGRSLGKLASWMQAKTQLRKSLAIIKSWSTFDKEKHLVVVNDLAIVEFKLGNAAEASVLFGQAAVLSEKVFGCSSDEEHLARADWAVSIRHAAIGRAVELSREAYDSLSGRYSTTHESLTYAARALVATLESARHTEEAETIRALHDIHRDEEPAFRPSWDRKSKLSSTNQNDPVIENSNLPML